MLANCIGATSGNSNRVRIHGVTALLGVLAHGDFACPPEAVVPHLEALLNGLGSVLALPSYAGRLQACVMLRSNLLWHADDSLLFPIVWRCCIGRQSTPSVQLRAV